jgi:2-keto-4-pentenoate hydratase/2-oxohepta-3-ene-1,7-dioic acid hydratase in catechol pathway
MKLATCCYEGGVPRIGVIVDDGIVDLAKIAPALPNLMLNLIRGDTSQLGDVRRAAGRGIPVPLASVRLLAPIPEPPEFLGVGLNYRDHVEEAGLALPGVPTVFNKQTSCVSGPFDDVLLPRLSSQLDYEGELGLVIGHAARNLSLAQAAAAIFGYVIVNVFSVRDWQLSSPTHTLGKSFDTHGPFGPWIVTADELPDPQDLALTTRVNGEVRQQGTTANMIFSCCEIVAFLSRFMTLQPGTIVTTGTPAGVGHCHRPTAYLRAGDLVTVAISGIGQIENRVKQEMVDDLR